MMGDREKCIQAQMDEYLSKPLQQNHLIQTILKCATLGGQLLEKNREQDLAQKPAKDRKPEHWHDQEGSTLRPHIEKRAVTSQEPMMGQAAESPALVSADQEDPLQRVSGHS